LVRRHLTETLMRIPRFVFPIAASAALVAVGCTSDVRWPGAQGDASVLLPNAWTLTPAGTHIPVGDLPLAMAVSPNGAYLAVANNGYTDQFVSIIDLDTRQQVDSVPMQKSWLGLAFSAVGDRLYVSAGADDAVEIYGFGDGRAEHQATLSIRAPGDSTPYFTSGLAVSGNGRWLLAAALRKNRVAKFDLTHPGAPRYVEVGAFPYGIVIDRDESTAFVSNWGDASISVIDLVADREVARIAVGSHPTAMQLSPDGATLYVADANSDDVSVVDVAQRSVRETIDLAPYPGAPAGSTPNGLALSDDGTTLFVVNANNNDVAMVDVSQTPATVRGLIPTGWYPTAVAFDGERDQLLVANGKGVRSKPNPGGPQPGVSQSHIEYIGVLFPGTMSFIPLPNDAQLATYSAQVAANNGFERMRGAQVVADEGGVRPRAIPRRVGEPSLIKHVFYIIKENRTYDQVLGDLPQGEGDGSLVLFGREVTPNHHSLAETFVLFDNFYVDAEVSADGHEWSTGAIATDFVEKLWPTSYSGRNFPYPSEGAFEIAYPDAGYLWDAAARAGLSYRSYGEFAQFGPGHSYPVRASVAGLEGHVAPNYAPWDLSFPDVERAAQFVEDFNALVEADAVPNLNIFHLPNDHTSGTSPGAPTPSSMVADNDLALGTIIEAIAHSRIWSTSAVFVLEDDAQNGPDHIDAHRSPALIASPYARHGFVDHTMYDTAAMLRTIELILGLPPMSQYDAAAVPMFAAFQDTPDTTPYTALPNQYPLTNLNTRVSYGSELSTRMNFADIDAAPEDLLNEIIWKSVKGETSVMPRPHTARGSGDLDGDDDRRP